ncbi:hypothetical protein JIG36_12065 [Actinoplanes sp. LDG1-06]|uniref:Uncharacterized protein n=1 Tax=Paractinoplanes ovalisporus TaxID=2810368 RepID=A0ABS2A8Y7_9ACTN|nr:hypothetical protein [Actinoplanes ovalisporus]MBM2616292.1 hypothetical protein [Actinoplanes ovalisporus]
MKDSATCVIDPSRPCGACLAAGPWQCPYLYLLDPSELALVGGHAGTELPDVREETGVALSEPGVAVTHNPKQEA